MDRALSSLLPATRATHFDLDFLLEFLLLACILIGKLLSCFEIGADSATLKVFPERFV